MRRLFAALLGVFLCFSSPVSFAEEEKTAEPTKSEEIQEERLESYEKLAERLLPSVVAISVVFVVLDKDNNERTLSVSGSGVFITSNGHILTCAHIFHGAIKAVNIKFHDGSIVAGDILYLDREKDLALIKVYNFEDDQPYVSVSESDPKIGQEIIVIGHPIGLGWSFVTGVISGLNRHIRDNQNLIQTNAVVNPGNSGGPLLNRKGELIGINVMIKNNYPIPNWSGQSFAVSTEELRRFIDKFKGI